MVFDQIVADFHRQLVRREGVRQRCTLRIAFGVHVVHVFKVRAVTSDAHVQTVADFDGVDLTGVDLPELGHLLLQSGVGLFGGLRGIPAGAKVKVGEPVSAGLLTVGNLVEAVFHVRGELVVHVLREFRFQQLHHGERQPGGNQRTATFIHVASVDDGGDDARVGRRASDFLLFQRFDERRLGIACRRLGFVAVRADFDRGKLVSLLHRWQ